MTTIPIAEVRATPVNLGFRVPELWSQGERRGVTAVIVEVVAADGLIGVGESVPAPHPEVTLAAIASVAEQLVGTDPAQVTRRWQQLMGSCGFGAFPYLANAALAGIEIACWDLLGRRLGVPVHQLLGGRVRDEVRFMGFVPWSPDIGRIEDEARALAAAGYDTVYVKGGFGERDDLASVRALRDAVGEDVHVRIDPNEAWTPDVALRMTRALEPLRPQYVEQPTRMDRLDELAVLRRRSPVPIAANQSSWLNHQVLDIIRAGAADVVMTDPWQAGGLRAMHAAAVLCETAGIPLVYHSFAPSSVATRAAMQVLAAAPACDLAHQTYHDMLDTDVVASPVGHPGGREPVDDLPGIGVELDADAMADAAARYRVEGYLSPYGFEPATRRAD